MSLVLPIGLDDVEMIKEIADIEGYKTSADGSHLINSFYTFDPFFNSKEAKAFILDLIDKYAIHFHKHGNEEDGFWYSACCDERHNSYSTNYDDSIAGAVMGAVIKLKRQAN